MKIGKQIRNTNEVSKYKNSIGLKYNFHVNTFKRPTVNFSMAYDIKCVHKYIHTYVMYLYQLNEYNLHQCLSNEIRYLLHK